MKKTLSVVLALTFVLASCITVFGAVTSDGGTGSATLTYSVAQSFTVTIPETVSLDTAGDGSGIVSVANAIIPFGENLTVTITDATNYSTGFRLKDGENESYISYTIANGAAAVTKDAAFLTVASGNATGSATLTFDASAPTKAGNFSDNLTFTVTVA